MPKLPTPGTTVAKLKCKKCGKEQPEFKDCTDPGCDQAVPEPPA